MTRNRDNLKYSLSIPCPKCEEVSLTITVEGWGTESCNIQRKCSSCGAKWIGVIQDDVEE